MSRQMGRLKTKNVIVTGGAGIIGKSFCSELLAEGASVVCIDRDGETQQIWAQSMKNQFEHFHFVPCDLSSESQLERSLLQVDQIFQQVDVVVNNAASKGHDLNRFFDPLETFSLDVWQEVMSINVDAVFLMAKHIGRRMQEKKVQGSFIQIASIYGVVAPDQRIYEGSEYLGRSINTPAVYSASKAAVLGLTKYLATYWGEHGIRSNAITPGGVESGQNQVFSQKYSHRVPLQRMAEVQDLTGALIYLASDESKYMTGQNLIVDGGLSVW